MVTEPFRDTRIELSHGSGGLASRRLLEGLIVPHLASSQFSAGALTDAAVLPIESGHLAFTADSFVVKPLRFAGGSIGSLAVHGTVNDLAVSGARPLALLSTFILEAGLPAVVLEAELAAMAAACSAAGVNIVGGDTKVVEHGKADGMYVTTCGIGMLEANVNLSPARVQVGDKVLLSGPIGDHGITVLLARGELDIEAELTSDSRSVWPMVQALLAVCAAEVRWMRDPTRGGVASSLNELAQDAELCVALREKDIPVRDCVRGACEVLGLDVLHVANEGQFLAVVAASAAEQALSAVRAVPGGEAAALIGEVESGPSGRLRVFTEHGSSRVVEMLVGEQLPRIC